MSRAEQPTVVAAILALVEEQREARISTEKQAAVSERHARRHFWLGVVAVPFVAAVIGAVAVIIAAIIR